MSIPSSPHQKAPQERFKRHKSIPYYKIWYAHLKCFETITQKEVPLSKYLMFCKSKLTTYLKLGIYSTFWRRLMELDKETVPILLMYVLLPFAILTGLVESATDFKFHKKEELPNMCSFAPVSKIQSCETQRKMWPAIFTTGCVDDWTLEFPSNFRISAYCAGVKTWAPLNVSGWGASTDPPSTKLTSRDVFLFFESLCWISYCNPFLAVYTVYVPVDIQWV